MSKAIKFLLLGFVLVGCCRNADDVWDDTKTAGRHVRRGFCSLGGKHGDSRQVCCREDFLHCDDDFCTDNFQSFQYEPLPDQEIAMVEPKFHPTKIRLPQEEPGQPMSHIPGIEAFKDPKQDGELRDIFQNVHFPYNSSLIKGKDNLDRLRSMAQYLKTAPETYMFVEGHCDERGAEAFNLALGARRSNAVRDFLIKEGVRPDTIFSVSYGKERPLDIGRTEEAWAKNRRAEFKTYQR